MSLRYNPFTGTLDLVGSSSSTTVSIGSALSGSTAHRILKVNSDGTLGETSNLTNGQLIIGSTGAAPVVASLTGTSNQVAIANGAGSITLSTPQDIATSSNVTFNSSTLNQLKKNDGGQLLVEEYFDPIVLTANSITAPNELKYDKTLYCGCKIEFTMKQDTSGDIRVGTMYVANTTITSNYTGHTVETADIDIAVSSTINGSNVEIQFNNTHLTNNVTLKADVKKFLS